MLVGDCLSFTRRRIGFLYFHKIALVSGRIIVKVEPKINAYKSNIAGMFRTLPPTCSHFSLSPELMSIYFAMISPKANARYS